MFNNLEGWAKNIHILNQNKTKRWRIDIQIGENTYRITRNLDKNVSSSGNVTAKVDLDFAVFDGKEWQSLNGTTRNKTDANIRKHFGTIEDFLLTSMASQMDSLSFVKEGSTKRKEILAKFLDLDLFDSKFKLAKKDLAEQSLWLSIFVQWIGILRSQRRQMSLMILKLTLKKTQLAVMK